MCVRLTQLSGILGPRRRRPWATLGMMRYGLALPEVLSLHEGSEYIDSDHCSSLYFTVLPLSVQYPVMVCVEAGYVSSPVSLPAQQSFVASQTLKVVPQ